MPIIVNSQPQLGKTTEYRLSIQADLNGFSFSVIDEKQKNLLYLFSSDFQMDVEDMDAFVKKCSELFSSLPILRSSYNSVSVIYNTEKFTAIPARLYKKGDELKVLGKIHKLDELDEINTIKVLKENMVVLYAVNSTFINLIKHYHPNFNLFPAIFLNLTYLPLFEEYNKLSFNYLKGVATIVGAEGDKIVYCNSFPAHHFNSALYFLFLALKEVQFNPETTTVYINGNVRDLEIYDMAKYFARVKYFRNPEIPLPDQFSELKYSSLLFEL